MSFSWPVRSLVHPELHEVYDVFGLVGDSIARELSEKRLQNITEVSSLYRCFWLALEALFNQLGEAEAKFLTNCTLK